MLEMPRSTLATHRIPACGGIRICLLLSCAAFLQGVRAEQPLQVPHLKVVSLQRGHIITRGGDYAETETQRTKTVTREKSRETNRMAAVHIELRSFSTPAPPYEVQCFFTAWEDGSRTVFDVIRTQSALQHDQLDLFSRDLYGGASQREVTTSTTDVVVTTTDGRKMAGRYRNEESRVKVIPGAKLEGWIVRVYSGGQLVGLEASLPELKAYALEKRGALDQAAAGVDAMPRSPTVENLARARARQ